MFIIDNFILNKSYEMQSNSLGDVDLYMDNFIHDLKLSSMEIYSSAKHRDCMSLLIINSSSSKIKSVINKYFKGLKISIDKDDDSCPITIKQVNYLEDLPKDTQKIFHNKISSDQPSCELYNVTVKFDEHVRNYIKRSIYKHSRNMIHGRLNKPLLFSYKGNEIYTYEKIDLSAINKKNKLCLGIISQKGKTLVQDGDQSYYVDKILINNSWYAIFHNIIIQDNFIIGSLQPYILEKIRGIIKSNVKAQSLRFVWLKDDKVIHQFNIKANDLERDLVICISQDKEVLNEVYTQLQYPIDHINLVESTEKKSFHIHTYSLISFLILLVYAIYLAIKRNRKLLSVLAIICGLFAPLETLITLGLFTFTQNKLTSIFARVSLITIVRFSLEQNVWTYIFFYKLLIINILFQLVTMINYFFPGKEL